MTVDARNFTAADVLAEIEDAGLTYPLFVKPSRAGSSFGVTKVRKPMTARPSRIVWPPPSPPPASTTGRCSSNRGLMVAKSNVPCCARRPVTSPRPAGPAIVLDHQTTTSSTIRLQVHGCLRQHVEVPANLPVSVLEDVRDVARRAFKAVDGAGLSRVDTFVTPDGTVMVNEINTMPGFTPISMYPKAWDATGVSYTELITRLIEGVLR